jgi:hypothetical protein
MGPQRTDVEVFTSIKDRPDATKIMTRLAYFTECIQNKGRDVDRLREQVGKYDPVALALEASRLSEDISRLEAEREAFITSTLASN